MENKGDPKLVLIELSDSKRVCLNPDIVRYNPKDPAPMFDLIIGTETMCRLGIVLDFKTRMVTLDKQTLPMLDIKSLKDQNQRYRILAS